MKVAVWALGKTNAVYLADGIEIYEKRLKNYLAFEWVILPDVKLKTNDPAAVKKEEGRVVLSRLNSDDYLVLLDELGASYSSVEFSRWMERRLLTGPRRLVFLIGGAYGFSPDVYNRAQEQLSLSRMTFSHQMVRLFLLEQLYRAMTIIRNEPYHNQGR